LYFVMTPSWVSAMTPKGTASSSASLSVGTWLAEMGGVRDSSGRGARSMVRRGNQFSRAAHQWQTVRAFMTLWHVAKPAHP
jgi:hypothetical protein